MVNPVGQPVYYTNDAAQRLIAVTDPLSRTTTMGYDADGHNLTSTNAAGNVTTQQYDLRGSLIKQADPAGRTVGRGYDAAGNLVTLTNRNGKIWQFKFDAANRLTNAITPLGRISLKAYNDRGLLAINVEPSGQTQAFAYDAKERLTNRADSVGTTLNSYDANDNLASITENGLTNAWTYDAYDRVVTSKDVYGNLIQYKYDLSGNLTNLIYPGGKNVYYSYDGLNHLTNVTDWSGRVTTTTYDLAGRVTGITRPNGTQRVITYDAAGQTTSILEKLSNGGTINLFKLGWDSAARMATEYSAPLPHAAGVPARTMTFDDDNRLTGVDGNTVVNDVDGNMTSGPLTNDTISAYVYDARNRLLNAGGVTNAYDPSGNRVGITYGTNSAAYVINPNAKLSQVLMRVQNGVTNYYIYGAGLLYQVTESATVTNTLTYHYDYRGSTLALTDGTGTNVTDRIEYSAYAKVTYRMGTSDTPFLYNGRYGVMTDPNGLLYMRARFYNPYICRFINPDPSGFSGGLNHYAFADGNPVNSSDPFGLGVLGENMINSSWMNTSMNGVPNVTATTTFQTVSAGSPASNPNLWFPASQNSSTTFSYQGDENFQQNLEAGMQVASAAVVAGLTVASLFTGQEELIPEELNVLAAEGTTTAPRVLTDAEQALYSRPSRPAGFRQQVWDGAKSADGNVYNPDGRILKFDEPWDAGHLPENKFSSAQIRAADEGWTRAQWIKYQNDPAIYRPELPSSNQGHLWENVGNW